MHRALRRLASTLVVSTALTTVPIGHAAFAQSSAGTATVVAADTATVVAGKQRARQRSLAFNLASFNILGSNHTDHRPRSKYAKGTTRARWAVDVLRENRISVVGFSEIQADQLETVLSHSGGKYSSYPSPDAPRNAVPTAIAWKTRWWKLVSASGFEIPFLGQKRIQTVVVLEHRATGHRAAFVNVHLAPVRKRDMSFGEADRDAGTDRMLQQVAKLVPTGMPVFLTGDMNERDEVFCDVTGRSSLVSASGGSNDGRRCIPPRPIRLDWIFGTRNVTFSDFRFENTELVKRITDHAVPVARVTVPPLR